MIRSKFFWKNFLSFMVIIFFTTFVVSYLLIIHAQQFIEATSNESLKEKLVIFAPYFEDGETWREPENIKKIIEIAREAKTRLTVLDDSENILLESDLDEILAKDSYKPRPEVLQAKIKETGTDKRISNSSKKETLYSAKKLSTPHGNLFLRVGEPMQNLQERMKGIFFALAVGSAFGMLLSLLLALVLVRRITEPVSDMTKVADAIARGNYGARIRKLPANELGNLGGSINSLAEAVQANISQREQMEKVRREFSSNISHELKTPLTSIKGYVETLQEGAIDDRETSLRFIRIINNNVERMISLVKDLMNLAHIEANQDILELEPVDWCPIIQEAVNRLQIKMDDKAISFSKNMSQDKVVVKGDRKAMSHILDNLLQNAVSYTPRNGQIQLHVDTDGRYCELSVRDTGIGIPKADQTRIFERFYRVDEARNRNDGGTGLGLAIVKHLVMQIHGTITVDSEVNHGSKFTVRLPQV